MQQEWETTPYIMKKGENMDQIARISEIIQPILDELSVHLVDCCWTRDKQNKILQIAICKGDGSMDLETCCTVSERISLLLDESELKDEAYFLEVCSPGAERPIKKLSDLALYVGKHVLVRFKRPIKNLPEVQGEVIKCSDVEVCIGYKDKAVTRKLNIPFDEIESARLAVKL